MIKFHFQFFNLSIFQILLVLLSMSNSVSHFDEQLLFLMQAAFAEDLGGEADHSTLAVIPSDTKGVAILKIKQEGILAGVAIAEKIFHYREPGAIFRPHKKD